MSARGLLAFVWGRFLCLTVQRLIQSDYFEKTRVFQAGVSQNTLAWNNSIGLHSEAVGLIEWRNANRDSWGHSYLTVRGEILGFFKDELLRKHLPRMFLLIKNES